MKVSSLASTSSLVSRKMVIASNEDLHVSLPSPFADLRDYTLQLVGSTLLTVAVDANDYSRLYVVGRDSCEFRVLMTNIQTNLITSTPTYGLTIFDTFIA